MPNNVLEKSHFIEELINYNLESVSKYSQSIANSINIAWLNYIDSKNGQKKVDRSLDKIYKNVDKLKEIEIKKTTLEELEKIKKDNIEFIDAIYKKYLLNIKYKKRLIYRIKEADSLADIIKELIDTYIYDNRKIIKKDSLNIVLPKMKEEKEVKKELSFMIDKNSYVYVNLKLENGTMIIDSNSFMLENEDYKKALKENKDSFSYIDKKLKYSPYEKKRRIFIQSMFDLEKGLMSLENKNMDITYPIDKYFFYSRMIVDNLYKELTNFSRTQNSVLHNLTELTIRAYGNDRLISKYDFIESEFRNKLIEVDEIVLNEFWSASNLLKKSYPEYLEIKNIVPNILDLYRVLNVKILRGVGVLIDDYVKDFYYSINRVAKYMNSDDLISLYWEIKNVLLKDSYKKNLLKKLIELQSVVSEILSDRFNESSEYVIKEYIKDEIIKD